MDNQEELPKEEVNLEDDFVEFDEDSPLTDLVIEITPEELEILDTEEKDLTQSQLPDQELEQDDENFLVSKHTIEDKHRLKWDVIFRGKKEPQENPDEREEWISNDNLEVDRTSTYWYESQDNENYLRDKKVKEKVFNVLSQKTDLDFLSNRRKPSRSDFNNYYYLLKTSLSGEGFTNTELFNELSIYFSDNLFNMFKLLDNKWRNMIISELQEHIGKKTNSLDLLPRNIHKDTEIEFEWLTENGNLKLITGVVVECDYDTKEYTVDSYESIYKIKIEDITKILNNSKFKYNLNKLNNIDFL